MFRRTQIYTLSEFLNKENEEEWKVLERLAGMAKYNKKLKAAMMIFLVNIFYIQDQLESSSVYAAADLVGKFNGLGNHFLSYIQVFGYWVCIVMCMVDIIKSLMQGDAKGAGRIFIKYLLAFIALYGVKFCFDEVKGVFEQR